MDSITVHLHLCCCPLRRAVIRSEFMPHIARRLVLSTVGHALSNGTNGIATALAAVGRPHVRGCHPCLAAAVARSTWRSRYTHEGVHARQSHAACMVTSRRTNNNKHVCGWTLHALRQVAATVEPADSDYSDMEDEAPAGPTRPHRGQENTPHWSRQLHDVHPPTCSFTATALQPRNRRSQQLTELGYLQAFLDPTLIDTFVINTNRFASEREAVHWTDVTSEEMWRYLAVRIRQGIVVLPTLHMYWQKGYADSYIGELMSRNRFIQLHRYFHISVPVPRGQKQTVVEKVTEFYHQCQRLFALYYEAGKDFAFDETMIRFEGRSYWITVIKNKPTPVGYKLFTVASEGYLMAFRIYRGKGGYDQPQNVLATTSWSWSNHGTTPTAPCSWITCTLPRPCATVCLRKAFVPAALAVPTGRFATRH